VRLEVKSSGCGLLEILRYGTLLRMSVPHFPSDNRSLLPALVWKPLRLFTSRGGFSDMKQSVPSPGMNGKLALCFLLFFGSDVKQMSAGSSSRRPTAYFFHRSSPTARTEWVLITLCQKQVMDCPSGYRGNSVCVCVCVCVCFLGE